MKKIFTSLLILIGCSPSFQDGESLIEQPCITCSAALSGETIESGTACPGSWQLWASSIKEVCYVDSACLEPCFKTFCANNGYDNKCVSCAHAEKQINLIGLLNACKNDI